MPRYDDDYWDWGKSVEGSHDLFPFACEPWKSIVGLKMLSAAMSASGRSGSIAEITFGMADWQEAMAC